MKGVWGMPRLLEAKKDVVSCEKSKVAASEMEGAQTVFVTANAG